MSKRIFLAVILGIAILSSGVTFAAVDREKPYARYILQVAGDSGAKCTVYDGNRNIPANPSNPDASCHNGATVSTFDDSGNKCYTFVTDVTSQGEIRNGSISCVKQ